VLTHIREAMPGDVEIVARIHDESRRAAYRHILPRRIPPGHGITALRRDWDAVLRTSGSWILLLEVDGQPVGFAAFGPSRDEDDEAREVSELYAIHLKPSVWGRGFGRALMAEVVRRLGTAGYAVATLWVLEGNTHAQGFYEQLGWRKDGGRKLIELGVQVPEIRYRLRLRDETLEPSAEPLDVRAAAGEELGAVAHIETGPPDDVGHVGVAGDETAAG
jgi:GNAT superfamily N-acetyltransferase